MATGKSKIELQSAPAAKHECLHNEDLASAREREWTGYCVFTMGGEAFRIDVGRLRDGVNHAIMPVITNLAPRRPAKAEEWKRPNKRLTATRPARQPQG